MEEVWRKEGKWGGSTVEDEAEIKMLTPTRLIPGLRRASKGKMASGQRMVSGVTYG